MLLKDPYPYPIHRNYKIKPVSYYYDPDNPFYQVKTTYHNKYRFNYIIWKYESPQNQMLSLIKFTLHRNINR
jgi:hypothetical protein